MNDIIFPFKNVMRSFSGKNKKKKQKRIKKSPPTQFGMVILIREPDSVIVNSEKTAILHININKSKANH